MGVNGRLYNNMAKIRNKVTGEVREVPDAQLGSFGIASPSATPSPSPSPEPQPAPQGGGVAGSLLSLFNPVDANQKLADTMYQGAAKAGQDKSAKGNFPKAFSNAVSNIGNVATQIPGVALENASNIYGLKGLKIGGKVTGTAIKYPTKGFAAKGAEKAAAAATKEGVVGDWGTLAKSIMSKTTDKLGNNKEIEDALTKLIQEKIPDATKFSQPALTPDELLKWRRQISARGAGNGVLANLFKGSNIEDKVNSVGRSAISGYLHDIAPKTKTPDKVYSIYKKLEKVGLGSPVRAGATLTGGYLGNEISKRTGVPAPIAELIGAFIGHGGL